MIDRIRCVEILHAISGMDDRWNAHREFWGDDDPGLSNDCGEVASHVCDLVAAGQEQELPEIFNLVEQLLVEGEPEVCDAVGTGILESLLNLMSWGNIPAESFVGLLGKNSRAYCRAWDEFTGVKTPHLEGPSAA